MSLLNPSFTDSTTFIVLYKVFLSLLGTVPPTKIAQLTWPQALHYHHRGREGRGGRVLQTKPRFSHSTLERKRNFSHAKGAGADLERNWWGANDGLAVIFLPSLSCHSICQSSTLGGCRKYSGLQGGGWEGLGVFSAPPTIEAVVEGASPAHFGSLFVSTHVAYYVNYFAGQKTTTGQDREREGRGRAWGPGILD